MPMDAARKALSVLLSFALVFSSVPTPALAEALGEEDQDAAAAQGWVDETGETVDEEPSTDEEGANEESFDAALEAQAVNKKEWTDEAGIIKYSYVDTYSDLGEHYLTIVEITVLGDELEDGSVDVVIPDSIEGVTVRVIGDGNQCMPYARNHAAAVRSITIPKSVTALGDKAFYGSALANVKTVTFEEGSPVTEIPKSCFGSLTGLEAIALPANLVIIGDSAFERCESLTAMPLPDSLKTIGDNAFADCANLATVSFGSSLTAAHLETIGSYAFCRTSIKEALIPDNVTAIGVGAFAAKTESVYLELETGYRGWFNVSTLKKVQLGSTQEASHLQTIGADAFSCAGIAEIALPNSLQSLGYSVGDPEEYETWKTPFSKCSLLESIVWPTAATADSFTSVGGFWDCVSLCDNNVISSLPSWVTTIDPCAFNGEQGNLRGGCSFTSLDIPTSIVEIGENAFYNNKLTEVHIPASVTSIGDRAFYCTKTTLSTLTIEDGTTPLSIGSFPFGYMKEGMDTVLPKRVTSMNHSVFINHELGASVAFHVYNKDVEIDFDHYDAAYDEQEDVTLYNESIGDLQEWSVGGTCYYPQDAAADSSIMRLKAAYAVADAYFQKKYNKPEWKLMEFVPFDGTTTKTYTITGTVPQGADVVLNVSGEAVAPTWDGTTLTYQAAENSKVSATLSLEGYATMILSPKEDESVAPLTANWTFEVAEEDMTPLSTMGALQVRAVGDHSEAANVAIFDADGKLVTQGRVLRARVFFAENIPAGTYTAVAWQANDYLSSIASVGDFAALGFDNNDYASTQVKLSERETKEVDLTVPALDTSKVKDILASGSLVVTSNRVLPGVTFYAKVEYEMAQGKTASAVKLNIPQGMVPVAASSPSKNYGIAGWDANTGILTIGELAEADREKSTITVNLKVDKAAEYAISASLTSAGATVPVDSVHVWAKAMELVVPQGTLTSATFTAHVYTTPSTQVNFRIGATDLEVTCTTNKAGHGQAELTIPVSEQNSYRNCTVTATTAGDNPVSVSETVEFSAADIAYEPTVQQFYFDMGNYDKMSDYDKSTRRIYLVKDGVETDKAYYAPYWNREFFLPTWPFVVVIDSLQPLQDTLTLQLGLCDESVEEVDMTLQGTEELESGVMRYTYRYDKPHGATYEEAVTNPPRSKYPTSYDIVPKLAQEEAVSPTLTQSDVDALKQVTAKSYDEWKGEVGSELLADYNEKLLSYWADDTTGANPDDLGVFNEAFRHQQWDPTGEIWATLTPEEQAKVVAVEDDIAYLYRYLAWYMGDDKPLYEYGSAQEYLADSYGYATGQTLDPNELADQGYSVIYDNATDSVDNAGTPNADGEIVAPAWSATRITMPDDEDGMASLDYADANGNVMSFSRPVDRWANGGMTAQAVSLPGEVDSDDSALDTLADGIDAASSAVDSIEKDIPDGASKGLGKGLGILGFFTTAFQQKKGLADWGDINSVIKEREAEYDRMQWMFDYYESRRTDKTQPMSACQKALQTEMELLKVYLKDLKACRWVTRFEWPLTLVCNGVGAYATIASLGIPGVQEVSVPVAVGAGIGSKVVSEVSSKVRAGITPNRTYHFNNFKRYRAYRENTCRQDTFGKLHYKRYPKFDPSGWVYEGVDDARVEGAIATIYRIVDGVRQVWDEAAAFDEVNPQTTGGDGVFAWNVPEGDWQVGVTKEGYEEAWSDVMHVLPEWTNVAINLLFKAAPKVTDHATDDDCTYVDVTFDIYMKVGEVPSVTIGGVAAEGATWQEPTLGRDEKDEEVQLSRTLRVPVPAGLPAGEAEVKLSGGYSYAGKSLGETSFTITIPVTPNWDRYAGDTALDTGKAVVEADKGATFAEGRGGTVIVATNDGYWDALAAAGLAGTLDAPVLITNKKNLSTQTEEEIRRLRPQRILIMGGTAAVSDTVRGQINDLGPITERIAGDNAVKTAVEIYRAGGGWSDTAIVATSSGYWDALSVAPYAWWGKAPIFLTNVKGNIDDATLNAIKDGGFKRVVVVGGTAAVTSAAQAKLEQAGAQVVRLAGDTALDTSGAIAAWEVGEGMGVSHLSVATSDGYWDALTGAAVCGKNASVLVLVGKDGAKDPWRAYDSASQLGKIEHGHVLGGTAAVSSAAWKHFTGTDEE